MEITLFFVRVLLFSLVVNFLVSLLLSKLLKRKAAMKERIRISSINDARMVALATLLKRLHRSISKDEQARLWSDAMNIIMTTDSHEVGAEYAEQAATALGPSGEEFRRQAIAILEKRFAKKSIPAGQAVESLS